MLVVESIEVRSLTLVWESGGITDHVSVGVVPSVIIIVVNSLLMVYGVNEDIALRVVCKVLETLNVFDLVVETSSQNECLIGVLSAVAEFQLVAVGLELGDLCEGVHARPRLNLGGDGCTLELKLCDVTMGNTKVRLRQYKARTLSNEGHLVVNAVALQELYQSSRVHATYENNIEISVGCGHIRLLLGTTASESSLVHSGKCSESGLSST